jgi:hypothetical protein
MVIASSAWGHLNAPYERGIDLDVHGVHFWNPSQAQLTPPRRPHGRRGGREAGLRHPDLARSPVEDLAVLGAGVDGDGDAAQDRRRGAEHGGG